MSWAPDLPNYKFADIKGKPTLTTDFTIPTDGLESPWAWRSCHSTMIAP